MIETLIYMVIYMVTCVVILVKAIIMQCSMPGVNQNTTIKRVMASELASELVGDGSDVNELVGVTKNILTAIHIKTGIEFVSLILLIPVIFPIWSTLNFATEIMYYITIGIVSLLTIIDFNRLTPRRAGIAILTSSVIIFSIYRVLQLSE